MQGAVGLAVGRALHQQRAVLHFDHHVRVQPADKGALGAFDRHGAIVGGLQINALRQRDRKFANT